MQKNIFIIVSCVVLVIAAIVGTVFLIKTDDLEPETAAIEIQGTWRVYQKGNNNPGYSYFIFDDSISGNPLKKIEINFTDIVIKSNNEHINIPLIIKEILSEQFSISKESVIIYGSSD